MFIKEKKILLLFNLVTYQIYHKLQNVSIAQYVDDFVIYTSDKKLKSANNTYKMT